MKRVSLYLLILSASIFAAEYHVDKEKENQVQFISEAPIEEIVGVTEKIDGYVLWDGDDKTKNSEFYFEVDLASIDTGIGLRNRHMRENYLETEKFPFAAFKGKIDQAVAAGETAFDIKTSGMFTLHGIDREIQISGKISKTKDGYMATSTFEIKLEDYKIERPQLMLLKIGETIQLNVKFHTKEFKE